MSFKTRKAVSSIIPVYKFCNIPLSEHFIVCTFILYTVDQTRNIKSIEYRNTLSYLHNRHLSPIFASSLIFFSLVFELPFLSCHLPDSAIYCDVKQIISRLW